MSIETIAAQAAKIARQHIAQEIPLPQCPIARQREEYRRQQAYLIAAAKLNPVQGLTVTVTA